jgi:hypothetical protein
MGWFCKYYRRGAAFDVGANSFAIGKGGGSQTHRG